MNSEIEFGQIEHSQPAAGLRPDLDRHFVVAACGDINDADLPIFVDMDVLRDMEAHARDNTRVELGGVMLGRQHVDATGRPFVVITDSLRAKHYEATKGSFKFTHETWNQITRQRNEFKDDLEMVGWYHTHPGWGVFLSGMDLFICDNFFNRPLDVALVIDPCAGDRGWFQWSDSEPGKTRQTPGFYLMTNRHRKSELNYFSDFFNNGQSLVPDLRFRQASFSEHINEREGDAMVNGIDNRRPVLELAIVSMLFVQLLVAGALGWRLIGGNGDADSKELTGRIAQLESQMEADQGRHESSIREQAYSDVLDRIVTQETGESGLVDQYAEMALQNRLLNENLEGQMARVKLAVNASDELTLKWKVEKIRSDKLETSLRDAEQAIQTVRKSNDELKSLVDDDETEAAGAYLPDWLIYTMSGVGLFVLGLAGGAVFHRGAGGSDQDDEMLAENEDSREFKLGPNAPEMTFESDTAKQGLSSAEEVVK